MAESTKETGKTINAVVMVTNTTQMATTTKAISKTINRTEREFTLGKTEKSMMESSYRV